MDIWRIYGGYTADGRQTCSGYTADIRHFDVVLSWQIWRIYGGYMADIRQICGGYTPVRFTDICHFDVSLSFSFYWIRHDNSLGGRGFPNDDAWWRGGRGVWAGDDVIIFCLPYVRRMSAVCPPHICRPSAVYPPYIRRISAIPNRPFCHIFYSIKQLVKTGIRLKNGSIALFFWDTRTLDLKSYNASFSEIWWNLLDKY